MIFLSHAYHTLCVAILTAHRKVQSEQIAVYNVDVTSLGSSESVDTTVERLIRLHLNCDTGVLAVDRNYRET